MSALLHAELLKLRTTRTFVALVAAAVALSVLVVVLTTLIADDLDAEDMESLFTADFSSLFILLLGVMGMAGEWRHRTITSTILAAPDRLRLLAAKVLSYAVAGMLLSLIVTVTIMVVGTLIQTAQDGVTLGVGDLADVLWRNLLVAALLGAFGVCVGGLLRNQVVAMVSILVLSFVLEPAIIGLAPDVGRFGPTSGAPNGILGVESFDDVDLLAPGNALIVMLAWVGATFTVAAAFLRGRDVV